jgi:DNA-binding transcriptional regulator YdaS (Cro superfamily)
LTNQSLLVYYLRMENEYLIQAINNVGTQAELARMLKVSPQRVQWWARHGLPAKWVIPVEKATGVPRHKLKPELYPPDGLTVQSNIVN